LHIAGKSGRLNALDTSFDLDNRYTVWSGLIGGFFLQLSYFGTDQSQVGRYLTGESDRQSRLGLLMNGFVKIPMQFMILLLGTLVFAFYQFHQPPAYFNRQLLDEVRSSSSGSELKAMENDFRYFHEKKKEKALELATSVRKGTEEKTEHLRNELAKLNKSCDSIRKNIIATIQKEKPEADANDTNYVFLTFVLDYLPHGLIGILIAIILLAAMGSTASGLNSLGSTTVVDIFRASEVKAPLPKRNWVNVSKWSTASWGVFSIITALYAGKLGNLIEAVNILGSLFYGTILGIFLTAFSLKNIKGSAVFYAAILTETFIVWAWLNDFSAFLWLNMIGALCVMILALVIDVFQKRRVVKSTH
ncbi:MAG: sodium:solute symporter family transporter, partial [Bacteroidota bacterium]